MTDNTKKELYTNYLKEALENERAKQLLSLRRKEIGESVKNSGFDIKKFSLDVKLF